MFILTFSHKGKSFAISTLTVTVTASTYSTSDHHLGHLRKLSIKIQRGKHLITYSCPVFCFLTNDATCIIFLPPHRRQEVCRPVIICSFSSLWSEVWVFLKLGLCSLCVRHVGGWVGAWLRSMRVGDNEGVSLHTSQIMRTSSLPFHYLFKGFGKNYRIVRLCR